MGQLEIMIRDLLDTVIPSQVIVINLDHYKASQWRAGLHDPRLFEEEVDFYLSALADLPAYQLQERLPLVCKVGSQEEVDHIINSAVSGIPIKRWRERRGAELCGGGKGGLHGRGVGADDRVDRRGVCDPRTL